MASGSEKVDHGPLPENQLEALNIEATSPKPESTTAGSNEALDWEALRHDSLQPGGFGSLRASIWSVDLHSYPFYFTNPQPGLACSVSKMTQRMQSKTDGNRLLRTQKNTLTNDKSNWTLTGALFYTP